ncbi:hypothetical protein [Delftia acidovorans]|uniref:hypothetical protein n=1 Tax=Delftia acidovorans TaxID=80866 RepID=UPI002FDF0A54
MNSITVTSKTGKQITLAIDDKCCGITATAGHISFGAEQTSAGFKSRFAADIGGGKRATIDVACEGAELAKVQALFAELHDGIARRNSFHAECESHRAGVLKMMAA